jgi:hypothetical protein
LLKTSPVTPGVFEIDVEGYIYPIFLFNLKKDGEDGESSVKHDR